MEIKIDRERGDPVELFTEIGQRLERFDSPNNAPNIEKIKKLGEQRKLVHVQAKNGMTKPFQDEQEEPASAAEIEHAFWRRAMEL